MYTLYLNKLTLNLFCESRCNFLITTLPIITLSKYYDLTYRLFSFRTVDIISESERGTADLKGNAVIQIFFLISIEIITFSNIHDIYYITPKKKNTKMNELAVNC